VQSSMFLVFDRNPQQYVPRIFTVDDRDFIKSAQKIHRNSSIQVQVLGADVRP
jgi:hypothetical protein